MNGFVPIEFLKPLFVAFLFSHSQVDERTLHEVYFRPFKALVDAGTDAVMCSYGLLNGDAACASGDSLNGVLKTDWGFDGFVVSDWGAVAYDRCYGAFAMGCDMDQQGFGYSPCNTPDNVAAVGTARIDDAAARIIRPLVRRNMVVGLQPGSPTTIGCSTIGELGSGEDGNCWAERGVADATSTSRDALNVQLASEAVVLLKNDGGILPLVEPSQAADPMRVAVVGSACDATHDTDGLLASWNIGDYYVHGGSGRVLSSSVVSVFGGLSSRAATAAAAGSFEVMSSLTDDVAAAAALLASADLVVACGGATANEDSDRESLYLDQDDFLASVGELSAAASVPLVVVALCPGPIFTHNFRDNAAAILSIFLGGSSTGDAIASVQHLFMDEATLIVANCTHST